jgi:hypothetical protein
MIIYFPLLCMLGPLSFLLFFYQFVLIVHFAQAYDALMKAFVDRNKVK